MAMLDKSGFGLVLLVDANGGFERTVTDGDLRRLLLQNAGLDESLARLPVIASQVGKEGISSREALGVMIEHEIAHLPIVDADGRVISVLERDNIVQPILLSTPHMGDTELGYIEDAFRTNWIAPMGPNVDAFEHEIAKLVGIDHAAAVSSGTAAIHLALRVLNVKRGDRVFCSTFTFAASANPIVYEGAEPVFIDSEPTSWNMSPRALEHAFDVAKSEGWLPAAVIVVNLYGQSADLDPIIALCDYYGVPLVEDAAESLGAFYKGRPSGTIGRVGIYSFNGNKIITTSGGGMLISNDKALIDKARFLSTQARDPAPHYQHSEIGFNYRMSNILAGVGRGQLSVLGERVKARRSVFDAYRKGLVDVPGLQWMPEPRWSEGTRWLSACTLDPGRTGISAGEVIARLAGEMIEARPLWKPMHLQPVFSGARYFPHSNTSTSDILFERGICLPSGSNMTKAEIERIVGTLKTIASSWAALEKAF